MDHADAVRSELTEKYLLGSLRGPQRDAFEEHFFECDLCAEDVRSGIALLDNAAAELQGSGPVPLHEFQVETPPVRTPVPQRNWKDWFRFDFRQPAFVLPTLAFLVVSGLWIRERASLAEATSPQLITEIPLDVKRGASPVSVTRSARYFAISFYIDEKYPSYAIEISGNGISPQTVIAPERSPDTTYDLLLPVSRFKPGRYDLKVRDGSTGSGRFVKQFSLNLE